MAINKHQKKLALLLGLLGNASAQAADGASFSIPQNPSDPAFPTSSSAFVTLQQLATHYWPTMVEHVLVQEGEKNLLEKFYAHGQIVVTNKTDSPFTYGSTTIGTGDENISIGNLSNILKETDGKIDLVSGDYIIKIRVPEGRFVLDEKKFAGGQAMLYVQNKQANLAGTEYEKGDCQGLVIGNIALLYNFVIQQLLVQLLNINANVPGKNRVLLWKPGTQEYPQWKVMITINPVTVGQDKEGKPIQKPVGTIAGFDFGVNFINPLSEKELLAKEVKVLPNENWNLIDDDKEKTPLFVKITQIGQGKTQVTWAREPKTGEPTNGTISPIKFSFNRPTLSQNVTCPTDVAK